MQFYWTINQIPELAGLTPEQTKEAWQFCYKKYAFKHWESWVSLFVLGILVAVGTRYLGIIGAAIAGGIGGGIFGLTATNVLRPHLQDYVSNHFTTTSSSTEDFSGN
ncbi:MAG: hypothetical protein DCF19_16930 [Pseudanabaena frigida]|uniref:Uncharacterized protein n=1 Tax=Pseudanabaena frigida TaxID=945775 RepID=A0A2W4XU35_9CYAN|nr:MAG: hypothetical protein DCF19_16930 [Pseudanabaena frigida]